jgi:hypothetical protein
MGGWSIFLFEAAGFFQMSLNLYHIMHLPIPDTASSLQSYHYENHKSHSLLEWILKKLD